MTDGASDRKRKRFEHLIKLFEVFCAHYDKQLQPSEKVRLNYVQLYNIVESYFQDIDRYKQYHFENPTRGLINDAKKAAFAVKWIIRVRPLYVHNDFAIGHNDLESFQYDDLGVVINELFSLYVAECFLEVALSPIKLAELLYVLRYRSPDEYVLMPIFQMIMDLRNGDPIIVK